MSTPDKNEASPKFRSLEVLDKSLTPTRRKVANEILLLLNSPRKQEGRGHALIVGPHGSGKSHVLTYLQKIIARFNESTRTIVVQEETRSIISLFDFLISCLRYCDTISPETIVETLKSRFPEPLTAIIALFDEYTEGESTAIFIEDFNDLFDNMDLANRSEMHSFFVERPHITMIASSITALEEKRTVLGTIASLFQVRKLPDLSLEETSTFLGKLLFDDKRLPARLQPVFQILHHLTGGNLRLMEMTGRFLENFDGRDVDAVFAPLAEQVLIPFYLKRITQLHSEQMTILKELALRLGQAMTLEEIAENIQIPADQLKKQLGALHRQEILTRTTLGNDSYFDIHEPLFRSFLLHGDHTVQNLGPLLQFVSIWFKAERRRSSFSLPREQIDEAELARGVALYESGDTEAASEILEQILRIESTNPVAVAHVFRIKLAADSDDAFAFLGKSLGSRPLEPEHPVQTVELLMDFVSKDAPYREELLKVYRLRHRVIVESLIHRFLENKSSSDSEVLGKAQAIIKSLAPAVPIMRILHGLILQYGDDAVSTRNALLHIPVELRTLVLKRTSAAQRLY